MKLLPRSFTHHQAPKRHTDGTISIYCRTCGRDIGRYARSAIRTVTKCQICLLKEQGVLNPEDSVLNQYVLSSDVDRIPIPLETSDELQSGVLLLYPEAQVEQEGILPQSGGIVGTVKSVFRAFGFGKPPEEKKIEVDPPQSLVTARSKRGSGLYGKG